MLPLFTVLALSAAICLAQDEPVTDITTSPRNTIHIAGNPNPVLVCEMDFSAELDGLQWVEYRTDPSQGQAVSLNGTILEGFEDLYRIQNEFHLELLDPDVSAEAKYECRNILAPQTRACANLGVLADDLQWRTSASEHDNVIISGEVVKFECWAEHSGGNWIPVITFDNSQGGIEETAYDCRIPEDGDNVVRQCVNITIDRVSGDWLYSCAVTYPAPPSDGDAGCDPFPPEFQANHTFDQLTVHWPPTNMVLLPENNSDIIVNEVLQCSAESSPPPTFHQWFDSERGVIEVNNTRIVVPEECAGIDQLCVTCLVLNVMRDDNYGQNEITHCYSVSEIVKSKMTAQQKATCFNPEMRKRHPRFRKPTFPHKIAPAVEAKPDIKTHARQPMDDARDAHADNDVISIRSHKDVGRQDGDVIKRAKSNKRGVPNMMRRQPHLNN